MMIVLENKRGKKRTLEKDFILFSQQSFYYVLKA